MNRTHILFFFIASIPMYGQTWFPKETPKDAFMYYHEGEEYRMLDTGLHIQEQINLTLTGKDEFGQYHLGNLGAPTQFLLFDYHRTPRLQWGMNPYPVGRRPKEDFKYYNVKAPVVSARYLQGYERGQSFDIDARLNVHERLGYNIRFQRLNSTGRYPRQTAEFNNFSVGYHYRSPSDRLRILGHFDSFSQRNDESGGIANEEDFTQNLQPTRELMGMQLNNHRSATRQRRFYTSAQYDIGYMKKVRTDTLSEADSITLAATLPSPDTTANDSLSPGNVDTDSVDVQRLFTPIFTLGSTVEYNRQSYVYQGARNELFYDNTYFNFQNTYDSTSFETFEQRFYLASPGKGNVRWMGGAGYELATYRGMFFTRPMTNLFVFGKGKIDWKGVDIRGNGQFSFAGTQIGNFLLDGEAGYKLEGIEITGLLDLSSIDPGAFYRFYGSNHFLWENDGYSPINHQYLGGRIRIKKWLEGQAGYHLFQNYTTLNQQAVPQQFEGVSQLFQAVLHTTLEAGKIIGWKNSVSYQVTDNALGPIRVPEWHIRSMVYTSFKAYKNRLNFQPGIEAHYFSSYYAPAWMPATGQFYLQDDQRIGNFPYLNFFLNFELKRALIFIKVENLSQGFMPYDYFISPGYPLPDRVLRLGIKWDFYN